ncbi:MAG: hypothetical protein RLZZ15_561 [Verrucomicrobiota bacterium]|jgi:transcriptional regulator with XRE-family HTH domain
MQTIGERLEEARKKKGISLREAAEATKIRGDYLQKLEANHFDLGLTDIYTRGFLRNYATFLKIPHERLLHDYAAVAGGEVRPRHVNREIYGRMDISVATAGEPSERATPPEEGAADAEPPRAKPNYPRSRGTGLPAGPDPALVFKYLKYVGYGAAVIVVLLVAKSVFGGKTPATEPSTNSAAATSATTPAATAVAVITALDVVVVQVWEKNLNAAPNVDPVGRELLARTTLARGESRTVPRNGPIFLYASAQENIQIDIGGKRVLPSAWGLTGAQRVVLE